MKKIKNKFSLSSSLILLIFVLAFAGTYFYKINRYDYREIIMDKYNVSNNSQYYSNNLVSNDVLKQQINLSSGNYCGLYLNFNELQKGNDDNLLVKVYHEDEVIAEQMILPENLISDFRVSFQNILNVKDDTFINLVIENQKIAQNDSVQLSLVEKNNSPDIFTINGLEQTDLINVRLIQLTADSSIKITYVIAAIFSFVFLLLCLNNSDRYKKIGYHGIFLRIFPIICLAYLTVFTPETIPDEAVHFDSAYQYSNIMMLNLKNKSEKRTCDLTYTSSDSIINKDSYYKVSDHDELFCSNNQMQFVDDNLITNAPIAYIPAAIGITIARVLNLGPLYLYNLGRICNILMCFVLMYYSIKKIPFGKSLLFSLCLLPMVTHLVCSYSYDGMIIAMSFLLTSYLLNMIYLEDRISKKDFLIVFILSILLSPCKIVYASICFLSFLIPKKNMSEFKYKYLPQALCIIGAIFSIFIVQFANLSVAGGQSNYITWADAPGYTLGWALANPSGAIHIFAKTIKKYGASYLTRMLGSSLGWLRVEIPWYVILGFIVIIFMAMVNDKNEDIKIKNTHKVWTLMLCLGSSLLIMYSMFTGHTPQGWDVIEGIQGRYFIPLLPMFYLVIRNNFIITDERRDILIVKLIGLFQSLTILTGFIAILNY